MFPRPHPMDSGWNNRLLVDAESESLDNVVVSSTTSSSAEQIEMGPLNEPILRESDLDENSTYYDAIIAAPSDADLHKMWLSLVTIVAIIAVFTLSVLIPILATKKTRKSPFNLYLIYLMLPDFGVSFFCSISCMYNVISGGYPTNVAWPCYLQSFYLVFSISSNAWLNAVVARQLLVLLRSSQHFGKYQPPTRRQVTMEAMGVYVLCGFTAFTGIMQSVGLSWESKWPHWTRLAYGAVCFPQPHDPSSLAYYFLVFFPLLFGIPLIYVVYASVTIVRQNLLPPSGRRRALAVYFFRLTVAFLVMWGPCLLFFCITGPFVSTWVYWIGAIWGHLQALVSSVMSLMKPDIWKVYKRFYTQTVWSWCLCGHNGPSDEERRAGSRTRPGMSTAFFMSTMMAPLKDEISPCEGKVRGSRDLRTAWTTGGPSSAFSSTSTPPDMDQARTRTNKDSSLCSGEALDAIEEGKLGRDGVPRASSSSSTPTISSAIETRSKGAQPITGCTGEDLPWECTHHEDV